MPAPAFSLRLLAAFFLLCLLAPLAQGQEVVDVILLSGQSNMQGSGQLAELPPHWQKPLPAAQYWDGEAFVPFDPTKLTSSGKGRFGPEVGFAHTFTSLFPNQQVYLIKFARSGQPLHHGWDGATWKGEEPGLGRRTFYPGQTSDDPNVGVHYRDLRQTFEAAMTALEKAGKEPRLRAIVWMQGEADSKHMLSAKNYDQSIKLLKRRIEEDMHADPVPFVMGQVLPHEPGIERHTFREVIRQTQLDTDMRSTSPKATPGVWTISTDGVPLLSDQVHYDTLGQLMLGQLFAIGVLQAETHLEMLSKLDRAAPPR